MADDAQFCALIKVPYIEPCMTMAEWSATWQTVGILLSLLIAVATAAKYFRDQAASREQASTAQKLERTRFFLEQHRRLFDDPDLKLVLQFLDGDDPALAQEDSWENNRKFLVFIEEIQLLIEAGMLNKDVCLYMFGYYAKCALNGPNFRSGIEFKEAHWHRFTAFCDSFSEYEARSLRGETMNHTL